MAHGVKKLHKSDVFGQTYGLHCRNCLKNTFPLCYNHTVRGQIMLKNSKERSGFALVWFLFSIAYTVVLLGTGYNFLAPFAAAIAAVTALIVFIRALFNKKFEPLFVVSYAYMILELFVYFLFWGADEFGKIVWYNLILSALPLFSGLMLYALDKKLPDGTLKRFATAALSLAMTATSLCYVFYMSLRIRPTVESLQAGHDAYLKELSKTQADATAPNVLIILMDDMAYSDISAYSYLGKANATIKTPNIDSLAEGGKYAEESGIFMENFYASAPVCTPSRFSLLTGRYATRGYIDNVIFPTPCDSDPYSITHFINPYQFLNNVDGILGDEITIAEALKAVGYDTSCIGKWNLGDYGEYLPTNQGFDYFYGSYYVNDMTPYNWVREVGGRAEEVRTHAENLDQSESTRLFTDELKSTLEKSIDNNKKFFSFYATPWPHYPIFSDNNGNGKGDTTDDNYIDCIEEFDKSLGEIFDMLEDKGVFDDTMIIFTSDNGPGREGVTGSLRGRKNTTFDGGMKVPMIVSYPTGVRNGTIKNSTGGYKIESSAMLTDLFPTILSYAGVDVLPSDRIIDGVNLKSLWSGEIAPDSRVHDALFYMKKGTVQAVQMPVEVGGVTYDFKYYQKVRTENSAFIDQQYKNYLFNLDKDPAEGYNISMTYPDVADTLLEALKDFRKSLKENRRGIK